ncbi:APO protein 4, mitochondrial [Linum perenne]
MVYLRVASARKSFVGDSNGYIRWCRFYRATEVDWRKLRSMIIKRVEDRAGKFPVKSMVPVAEEVLTARMRVIRGVSALVKSVPVVACKFCSEVFVGGEGHLIQTCKGYKRIGKKRVHEWIPGTMNDVFVPVESFHLPTMSHKVIKHEQRFDFDRVPAVVELCWQAGAQSDDHDPLNIECVESEPHDDLRFIANRTLKAWDALRSGVEKLLLAYPARVCKHCSEVHIGTSGHKARLCGVFKYESWRGTHFWQKAKVDDLVPPKVVWSRRPQDPPALSNEGRDFYGHAPAVVDLCAKAGAIVPTKYYCMMKVQGWSPLTRPPVNKIDS